jgi:hypothetical protein
VDLPDSGGVALARASVPVVDHALHEAVDVPVARPAEVELARRSAISSRLRHGDSPSLVMQVGQATRMNGGPDIRSTERTITTLTPGSQQ